MQNQSRILEKESSGEEERISPTKGLLKNIRSGGVRGRKEKADPPYNVVGGGHLNTTTYGK